MGAAEKGVFHLKIDTQNRVFEAWAFAMNPPSPKLAYIKAFSKQIRKKVHRLLYHSLCTDVAQKEGFEPSRRF